MFNCREKINSAGVSFQCDKVPTTVVKLRNTKKWASYRRHVRKHEGQRYNNQYAKTM